MTIKTVTKEEKNDNFIREIETMICMECANDKIFYDSEKEEHYCPVCEQ